MPPYEINGKQVDDAECGHRPADRDPAVHERETASRAGRPGLRAADQLRNDRTTSTVSKYPYNPFYAGFSPRVSLAWNPKYGSGLLGKLLGDGKTVIRGGYARIYGRLNGVDLLLVPLLGPGLLQAVSCTIPTITGTVRRGTPATGFRIGPDGLTAPLSDELTRNSAAAVHSGRRAERGSECRGGRWLAARSEREAEPFRRSELHDPAVPRRRSCWSKSATSDARSPTNSRRSIWTRFRTMTTLERPELRPGLRQRLY